MELNSFLELLSALFSLVYVILVIRQNIWCWINGIMGSGIAIYLFIQSGLYSEALLYGFYVLAGIYGWLVWSGVFSKGKPKQVQQWNWVKHLVFSLAALALAVALAVFSNNLDGSKKVWADGLSTAFSFLATYMEAHKVLTAWVYWIAINAFSVWLYHSQGLNLLALNMVVYVPLSIYGLYSWRKAMLAQKAQTAL
ncbi:nicotinamide riboside transporter PnuC [bacterium SCSIO 12741]|nr:nicotinamide riboside transporter PnuC [bacterium SCSIO 12741]